MCPHQIHLLYKAFSNLVTYRNYLVTQSLLYYLLTNLSLFLILIIYTPTVQCTYVLPLQGSIDVHCTVYSQYFVRYLIPYVLFISGIWFIASYPVVEPLFLLNVLLNITVPFNPIPHCLSVGYICASQKGHTRCSTAELVGKLHLQLF